MKRGEIWFCELPNPNGSIQGYPRPCVIVQCNMGNKHSTTITVCPLSTQNKKFNTTHVKVDTLRKTSWIECEQIVTINKSQLSRMISKLDEETMNEVNNKIKLHLGLEETN